MHSNIKIDLHTCLYTPLPGSSKYMLITLGVGMMSSHPFLSVLLCRKGTVYKGYGLRWLGHHPFSGPPASAGELLHTPWRIPTFMATALLS